MRSGAAFIVREHGPDVFVRAENLGAAVHGDLVMARLRRHRGRIEGVVERIGVLVNALRHIDDYAALVATRIRRGFTRRFLHLFALPPAPPKRLVTLAAPGAICVDSS